MSAKLRDPALYAMLCVVWGTTWLAIKVGLQDAAPLWLAGTRFVVAASGLTLLAAALRAPWPRGRSQWGLDALLSLLMFALPYAAVFWGVQFVTSGQASVLYAVQPFLMAAVAHRWMEGERITARRAAGMFLGFSGVALIFWRELFAVSRESAWGGLAIVGAAVCGTLANLAAKGRLHRQHPVTATAVQLWLAALVVAAAAWLGGTPAPDRITAGLAGSVLYLGLAGTSLAFAVYYWLLQRLYATTLSLIAFVVPVVAVSAGAAVLSEPLRPDFLAGCAMVLGGVLTVSYSRASNRPRAGIAVAAELGK